MKHFALVGNPNCGKTTLFNSLTGSTAHVGNWPGVTVDKREGNYKKLNELISIVDLPGIYSLSPYTPEEVISRNYILDEKPDCVINIIDATNLERNLYLTTQLLEIDVPIIIALNMMDALDKIGDKLNVELLEKKFNIPVVEISALKEFNLDLLMERAYKVSLEPRKARTVLEGGTLSHLVKDVQTAFTGIKVDNPLFHAVKLVELDDLETTNHPELVGIVEEFKKSFNDEIFGADFEAIIADSRYKYITSNLQGVKITSKKFRYDEELTKSDKIDIVLTNKWVGIPIFLGILFLVFHLTFSENLFFLKFIFENFEPSFAETAFEGLLWTEAGLNSPGIILFNLVDSSTGYIGEVIAGLFGDSPEWVSGLIVDGVLGGIFGVLSFVPQILVLFLFFSILEDSGYMARVAFILDKIFRKFGLSGRSFMPMIMGFGCSVPAMINTRTLSDENEKTATIRVIPFFSCGAKLPILTAIAGGILAVFKVGNADLITYGMYVLGMTTAIVTVLLMRSTTMRGEVPPFIMELPTYHMPQFKSLMRHLWDKLKHYIEKAFTVILASTIVIWFLSHFTWEWQLVDDTQMHLSILASLGKFIQPIFTPMGFGSQLSTFGWVFGVAALTGLIAKENVVATFATLAACLVSLMNNNPEYILQFGNLDFTLLEDGVKATEAMISATGISMGGLLAYIAFNMTTIPCFATVATAKAELTNKRFKYTLLFWIATSYITSTIIYLAFEFTWSLSIIIPLFIVIIIGIKLFNKYRDVKGQLK